MGTRVNRRKVCARIGVVVEVRQESLLDAARYSRQFDNGLLKNVDVRRIRACAACSAVAGGWDIREIALPVILVEADDRLNHAAAEEAAAVIVDIETEIESGAKRVFAADPRDVVHDLRRGDRALRVRREAVRQV